MTQIRQMTADFDFHVGNTSCWTCFSISQRARISVSPRTDAETSSAWRDDNKHEKRKRRDVCVQRPRFSLTQIAPIPPKAYSNISWDSREIITLVFSSDAARNVPTPPTTHHSFLITHYSKCSSVLLSNLTTRNSSLTTRHWKLHLQFTKPRICHQIIKKLPYH